MDTQTSLRLANHITLLSNKFLMLMIIWTQVLISVIAAKTRRAVSVFTVSGAYLVTTVNNSLGGDIIISKPVTTPLSFFSVIVNYGLLTAYSFDFQVVNTLQTQQIRIPLFFVQKIINESNAYANALGSGTSNLALYNVSSGCSCVYVDRTHEIMDGTYDPVEEFYNLFKGSITLVNVKEINGIK